MARPTWWWPPPCAAAFNTKSRPAVLPPSAQPTNPSRTAPLAVPPRLDRVWRVKSKHSVCAIASYDLDGDGLPELISGWSNGRVRRGGGGSEARGDEGRRAGGGV